MGINFTMPTSPAEVPVALTNINNQIAAAKAHLEALTGIKKAIQNMCAHKNKGHKYDYDGGSSSWCNDCGKDLY